MHFKRSKQKRWLIIDQSFRSLFVIFTMIELSNILGSVIDGLLVSNFMDPLSLAAVGISAPIFTISGLISGLFATGMQAMCARKLGEGDLNTLNRLFSSAFYIGLWASFFFGAAGLIFSESFASLFGASGDGKELSELASLYIRGVSTGCPALILNVIVASGCQLDNDKRRVMKATVLYAASNIALDIVFILSGSGVFGIGCATSIASYTELAYLMLHFRKKDSLLKLSGFDMRPAEAKELISSGTEKALRRLSNIVAPVLMNHMCIYYGGLDTMTALTVQRSIIRFTGVLAIALADALALQAGVCYGEKDAEAVRAACDATHRCCAEVVVPVAVLNLLLAYPITALYISGRGSLFYLTLQGVCIAALNAPLHTFIRTRITYLLAVHKTRNMQAMILLNSLFYPLLFSFILGRLQGKTGMLAVNLACPAAGLITVWLYYAVKKKKLIPSAGDYLDLPHDLICPPQDIISMDIREVEDISLAAQQIQLFCKGHRINKKIGMRAAICFEELTRNIFEHGFKMCRKKPGIDLRVVYSKDDLVMRLKDNCPYFDVEHYIAKQDGSSEEDHGKNIGLRLVRELAENISYIHMIETNNVIMKFSLKQADGVEYAGKRSFENDR